MLDVLVPVLLVLLVVGVHYEALNLASGTLRRIGRVYRTRVALAVLIALVAHFTESFIFAIGWLVAIKTGNVELSITDPTMADLVYFSLSNYTSLGYGDIIPSGSGRVLAGIEALTGLVLIAWTASFTYLEMREFWPHDT